MEPGDVRGGLALGSAPPALHARRHRGDNLPQRVFIHRHSERVLPATGYGVDGRECFGVAGYFLPGDAGEIETIYGYCSERSGAEDPGWRNGRRLGKYRA